MINLRSLKLPAFSILFISSPIPVVHATEADDSAVRNDTVGWTDERCFAVRNPAIPVGSSIVVVVPGEEDNPVKVTVLGKTADSSDCGALAEERRLVNMQDYDFYALSEPPAFMPGIGYVRKLPGDASGDGKADLLDVDGDGTRDKFEVCTSYEGVHFTLRSGAGDADAPLWSGYYYLGYDVEPTCP